MSNLTKTELQNLQRLIEIQKTSYEKLNNYATQVEDAELKQLFKNATQDALNTKQKLMSFLN